MLDVLIALEEEMPRLLDRPWAWKAINIFFKPAFKIDRVIGKWERNGELYTIRLHQFHPYQLTSDAVIHHHNWPMATRVCEGRYELQLGWSETDEQPKAHTTCIIEQGSAYEMVHVDAWHSVRPLVPTWTLMVFAQDRWRPQKRPNPQGDDMSYEPMPVHQKMGILSRYRQFYQSKDAVQDTAPVA